MQKQSVLCKNLDINWLELLAVMVLWVLLDFRFVRFGDYSYFINSLVLSGLILAYFGYKKRLLDFLPKLDWLDFKLAFSFLPLMAMVILPIAFIFQFVALRANWQEIFLAPLYFLGIALFIALPEELVFRGILLRFLASKYSDLTANIFSAIIFGLFHFNNAKFGETFNWKYVILATIAGLFYGKIYLRPCTKASLGFNITAAIWLHALVDTIWKTFLLK